MSVSLPLGASARSASILVVDDELDVADLFWQRRRRHWIVSQRKSSPHSSLSFLTSTCRVWTGWNCLARSNSVVRIWPVMMVTAYGDAEPANSGLVSSSPSRSISIN